MHIKVFETFNGGDKVLTEMEELLAQEGKTIVIRQIFTAASATESYSRHFVTVTYDTLETAPEV